MTDINKTILEKLLVLLDSIRMSNVDFGDLWGAGDCFMHLGGGKGQDIPGAVFDNPLWYFRALSSCFGQDLPSFRWKQPATIFEKTKDLGLVASIVSDDCRHSPFGLIIHTDHPSGISPTDMSLQYPNLFEKKEETASPEKETILETSL